MASKYLLGVLICAYEGTGSRHVFTNFMERENSIILQIVSTKTKTIGPLHHDSLTLLLYTTSSPSRMQPRLMGQSGLPNLSESRMALSQISNNITNTKHTVRAYLCSADLSLVLSFPLLEKIWMCLVPLLMSIWIWQYSPSIFCSTLTSRPMTMSKQFLILRPLNHGCRPTLTPNFGLRIMAT